MADTFTNLIYHIIFSTKNRDPLIEEPIRERLYEYIGGIIRSERGTLLEVGGMPDHIHLLTRFRPTPSLPDMVKSIKSSSSKWLNQDVRLTPRFAWQTGYGAFTVSESQIPGVQRYIRNQAKHHARRSFKDELITLLRKNGIEFDERYLLD